MISAIFSPLPYVPMQGNGVGRDAGSRNVNITRKQGGKVLKEGLLMYNHPRHTHISKYKRQFLADRQTTGIFHISTLFYLNLITLTKHVHINSHFSDTELLKLFEPSP